MEDQHKVQPLSAVIPWTPGLLAETFKDASIVVFPRLSRAVISPESAALSTTVSGQNRDAT